MSKPVEEAALRGAIVRQPVHRWFRRPTTRYGRVIMVDYPAPVVTVEFDNGRLERFPLDALEFHGFQEDGGDGAT